MDWINFYMPVKLISGRNCIRENPGEMNLGKKAMIVVGGRSAKSNGSLDDVLYALEANNIRHVLFDEVQPNPMMSACERAGQIAREEKVDFIIGIGGGSALDSAKTISALAAADIPKESLYQRGWDYPTLPLAVVGTTAGTGSEVSPYAVITDDETHKKKSLGSPRLFAKIAFCDPKYTDAMPVKITLPTTLDAFCHACEGFFSNRGNAISEMFSIEAVQLLLPIYRAYRKNPADFVFSPDTRDRLYYASILAGFALNIASTCFGHAVGYFLSEEYHVPHGYACAIFLPGCLDRAERYVPEKSERFYRAIGSSKAELVGIVKDLLDYEMPVMTKDEVDRVVRRWDAAVPANFARTPGSFSKEEARRLIEELFVQ
jgi:alcohol dehydrogenase class IV